MRRTKQVAHERTTSRHTNEAQVFEPAQMTCQASDGFGRLMSVLQSPEWTMGRRDGSGYLPENTGPTPHPKKNFNKPRKMPKNIQQRVFASGHPPNY
jgi:hypothetical protein